MKKNIVNIATLSAPKVKPIVVPGVGTVCIKPMNARALLALNEKQQALQKGDKALSTSESIEIGVILLSNSLCDEAGVLSYTNETKDSILDLPMPVLQSLLDKALPEIMKLNGMGDVEAINKLPNAQNLSSTVN